MEAVTPETQAHPPGPSRTPRGAGPARVCSASLSCATRSQCPPVQLGSRAPASHQTHEDARTAPSRGALRPTHWRLGRRAARAVYGSLARCGHAHQAEGRCAEWPVRQPVNAHGQHGGARGDGARGEAALSSRCAAVRPALLWRCAAVQRPSMRLWRSTAILSGVGGPSARWLDFGRCAGGAPVSLPFWQARGHDGTFCFKCQASIVKRSRMRGESCQRFVTFDPSGMSSRDCGAKLHIPDVSGC